MTKIHSTVALPTIKNMECLALEISSGVKICANYIAD
jgi:hypothetical protein